MKAQKKKRTQKFVIVAEKLQEAESANKELNLLVEQLQTERDTYASEIESYALKLQTATNFNNDSEKSLNSLGKDLVQKIKAIAALETEINALKGEIEGFTAERQKMLDVLFRVQYLLTESDSAVEVLQKEIVVLKGRLRAAERPTRAQLQQDDFSKLVVPFEGIMKFKVLEALNSVQYQPSQRIQIVLNDMAIHIKDLANTTDSATKKLRDLSQEYREYQSNGSRQTEVFIAFLENIKQIAMNQSIINSSELARHDPVFMDFVEKKLEEFNPIIQLEAIKEPKYVPRDFFMTSDITKRKEAVLRLLQPTDSTLSMFTAQFLTNIFLQNQLSAVTEPLRQIEEIGKSGFLKGMKVGDFPRIIKSMQHQISDKNTKNKKLASSMKQLQTDYNKLLQQDSTNRTKLTELTFQVQTLSNDKDIISAKMNVLQNEILLKNNECTGLTAFANEIREGVEEHKHNQVERCARLEEAVRIKDRENSELTTLIRNLQQTLDRTTHDNAKAIKKNEEALLAEIENLQAQLDNAELRHVQKKKQIKQTEKNLREQYEHSLKELAIKYKESKAAQDSAIAVLKDKLKQANELSSKLVASLADAEKRGQALQEENAVLKKEQARLNVEIQTTKSSVAKEIQSQSAQLSAQLIAAETKATKATFEVRGEFETQRAKILATAYDTIGTFYGNSARDFDFDTYKSTLEKAREDLDKLHFFQEEHTKVLSGKGA